MTRPKWPTHQKKTLLVKRDWTSRRPPWRCTFESCIKMESRAGGTAGKKHRREAKQFENIKAPEPDDTALFRLDTTSSGAPKYGDSFPYTRGCGKPKSTSESKG